MRLSILFPSFCFLVFCWFSGVALGIAKTNAAATEQDRPYAAVMHEAVDGLRDYGIQVEYPQHLPPILPCGACLAKREAFGAYEMNLDGIVVPDNFDVTTLEGRSILIHEYGHYVMTKAGVPFERQEKFCLMLGNSVFQKHFAMMANR